MSLQGSPWDHWACLVPKGFSTSAMCLSSHCTAPNVLLREIGVQLTSHGDMAVLDSHWMQAAKVDGQCTCCGWWRLIYGCHDSWWPCSPHWWCGSAGHHLWLLRGMGWAVGHCGSHSTCVWDLIHFVWWHGSTFSRNCGWKLSWRLERWHKVSRTSAHCNSFCNHTLQVPPLPGLPFTYFHPLLLSVMSLMSAHVPVWEEGAWLAGLDSTS